MFMAMTYSPTYSLSGEGTKMNLIKLSAEEKLNSDKTCFFNKNIFIKAYSLINSQYRNNLLYEPCRFCGAFANQYLFYQI